MKLQRIPRVSYLERVAMLGAMGATLREASRECRREVAPILRALRLPENAANEVLQARRKQLQTKARVLNLRANQAEDDAINLLGGLIVGYTPEP